MTIRLEPIVDAKSNSLNRLQHLESLCWTAGVFILFWADTNHVHCVFVLTRQDATIGPKALAHSGTNGDLAS